MKKLFCKRSLIVGLFFTGKNDLILKKPRFILNGDIPIIARSREQYSDEFRTEEENGEISEYEGAIVVF